MISESSQTSKLGYQRNSTSKHLEKKAEIRFEISALTNVLLSSDMNSLLCTSTKSTRAFRGTPVLKGLLRRGVSTQELDASKGGKSDHTRS